MKALFLDRDGVLNQNVFYQDTGAHESPRTVADFSLLPDAISSLLQLQAAGYKLFLVSNQPNVAKGKSQLQELVEIQAKLKSALDQAGISFAAFYYCYHHPDSTVPIYGGVCECRKPSPNFLKRAEAEYSIDLTVSWMVGDRISDIECGKRAGVRTVLVGLQQLPTSELQPGSSPDAIAADLGEATRYILQQDGER